MSVANVALRFWSKVDQTAGLFGCWPWMGYRMPNGYGQFGLERRIVLAHRTAWTLARGPIPDGMQANHHCDNPPCCNPAHLFLGDQRANVLDMVAKGRHTTRVHPERIARGSRHGCAKLTEEQVAAIRSRPSASPLALALEYGVDRGTIWKIRRGRSWAAA